MSKTNKKDRFRQRPNPPKTEEAKKNFEKYTLDHGKAKKHK